MAEEIGFNEDAAVSFIRGAIPEGISRKYTDEDILYIIDIIWDYYDSNGFTSLNNIDADEDLLDFDDLMKYVKKTVVEDDEMEMNPRDLNFIVKAELDYEESIENIF